MKCIVILALLGSVLAAENCAANDPNGACMQDEALSLLQTRAAVQRHTDDSDNATATTATNTTAEQDCFGAHARHSFLKVGGIILRNKASKKIVKVKAMTCKAEGPQPFSTTWDTPVNVSDTTMAHEVPSEYFGIRNRNHSNVSYKFMVVTGSSPFGGFAVKPANYHQTLYFPVVPTAWVNATATAEENEKWKSDPVADGLIDLFSHSPHVMVNLPMAVATGTELTVQNDATWSFWEKTGDVSNWFNFTIYPGIEIAWAYAPSV